MELNNLSDDQLFAGLESELAIERRANHNSLMYLKEIKSRRLYAKRGFSNMFKMLVKHFRQSESAAYQRLKALELLMGIPGLESRLVLGDVNMSTVAMAQRQILREEKSLGEKISQEKKTAIVASIVGKTLAETEMELFKHLPKTASEPQTYVRRVSAATTRMNLNIPNDVQDMMTRLQELWAHVDPQMDPVEVIRRAFTLTLKQVDPVQRPKSSKPSESAKHRSNKRLNYYGREFDRALWKRAGARCEYVDRQTGRRCDCTFGLQHEHVIAIALGGTNELTNMQLLCSTHNQLRARKVFGDRKIDAHIRQ